METKGKRNVSFTQGGDGTNNNPGKRVGMRNYTKAHANRKIQVCGNGYYDQFTTK